MPNTRSGYDEARRVYRRYTKKLQRLSSAATAGDESAAIKLIRAMTEQNAALRQLGWMVGGEDGRPKLVPFQPDEISDDLREARNGDIEAAKRIVRKIASQPPEED